MPVRLFTAAAVLACLGGGQLQACPFCSPGGQTLTGEINQSDFIVLGTMTNARRDADGDLSKGTTDLVIDSVVKPHPYLAGKSMLRLPRYVPADPKAANDKFLVFCQLYTRPADLAAAAVASPLAVANNGAMTLDAVRGEAVRADSKIADYLKGAFEVRQKDTLARLTYFFQHLDSPEVVISADALNEFAMTDYADVRKVGPTLPAAKILAWLKDPATPRSRIGLYGLFLGHCGKPADAATVRQLLDAPDNKFASGLDGLMAGYTLLDPKAGYEYILGQLKKPDADFQGRYAALKTARFFWDFRPDVVSHDQVLEAVKTVVSQPDMADLAIEDLRKWGVWGLTDYVIGFADQKDHAAIPITRRAILRFALAAPVEQKAAKEYADRIRREDPERVKYVEQTLKDEQTPAKPSDPAASPPKKP